MHVHVYTCTCLHYTSFTVAGSRRRAVGGKVRRLHPIPLHDDGELLTSHMQAI